MSNTTISFSDNIAGRYEELLGPFIFEPFAVELAERARDVPAMDVLELACGTGRLTRRLAKELAAGVRLTATDINEEMLTVAKESMSYADVKWGVADMMSLPFEDGSFDLVVAQFGMMFAPDAAKAFGEVRRVLRDGGRFVFNTWATAAENPVWWALGQTLRGVFGDAANGPTEQPFSMSEEGKVMQLLEDSGFSAVSAHRVRRIGRIDNAAMAAKGMIEGLPVISMVRARAPQGLPAMLEQLEERYTATFGDQPMVAPLSARVYEASFSSSKNVRP
jgi:ubiquinone/menaquinone biosynthesis C-methylase UbiE